MQLMPGTIKDAKSNIKMLDKFSNVSRNSPIYEEYQIKFAKVLALSLKTIPYSTPFTKAD